MFYDNPLSEEMNPYRAELAAFLHAVVHKTEPVVTPAEAIAALHIALAAKESARSGKVYVYERIKNRSCQL